MKYLEPFDINSEQFGEFFDELPLWSAPFGLKMLDKLPVKAGMKILDVGAGTGFLTLELAQRFGRSTTVVAVDPWQVATTRLHDKVRYLGLDNVQVKEMDVLDFNAPSASFDLIVSNLGVNNFQNKQQVFNKLFSLGKPGSKLCFTSNVRGHFEEFYTVLEAILLDHELPTDLLKRHVNARGDKNIIISELRHSGFDLTQYESDHFNMRFADGSAFLRHYLIRAGFLGDWLTLMPEHKTQGVFERLEQELNLMAVQQNGFSVSVPVVYIEAGHAT